MSQRTSSSGIARSTGWRPPGSGNAPEISCSPRLSTGASSREPQMRQVVRVRRLGGDRLMRHRADPTLRALGPGSARLPGMSTETRRGGGPARLARVWSWWTRHPALAAAAIYAVLSLLFLGPSLLPHKTLSNSDVLWFSP